MTNEASQLARFLSRSERIAVITGAGVSTVSGIPDYRDEHGEWKRPEPIRHQLFMGDERARRRYWSRSMHGFRFMARARPNAAHRALAALEQGGRLRGIVTQNVDRLHQKAGSRGVVDLHGRIDRVECMGCGRVTSRRLLQEELEKRNGLATRHVEVAPDGDADIESFDLDTFEVPDCAICGGILKPAVTFFGGTVPATTHRAAEAIIDEADALLVVGTSLMVFSAYRLARRAAGRGIPIAAVNRGRTRADDLIATKVEACCVDTLPGVTPG